MSTDSRNRTPIVVEHPRNHQRQDELKLQEALDVAGTSGGGHIVVAPGTWNLTSSPLRIYANTRLTLTPGTQLIRTGALRTMLINGPYHGDRHQGGHGGPGNIIVEGGIWDVNGVDNPLPAFGMVFNHGRDIVVRDLEIRNTPEWHAIEINSTYNVTVQGCRFIDAIPRPNHPWQVEAVSIDLAARGLTAWGAEDDTNTHHVKIIGNYCSGFPTFAGCHTPHPTEEHSDVLIAQNTGSGMSCWAVNLTNTSRVSVTGNVFTETANGIRVTTTDQVPRKPVHSIAIVGNVIQCLGDGRPIVLEGYPGAEVGSVIVSGNVLRSRASEIISVSCTLGVVIGDNAIGQG